MMSVNSITGANANMMAGGAGVNIQADSISRNIQNQIAAAQKKLQELSSDNDMKLEEKMKKSRRYSRKSITLTSS